MKYTHLLPFMDREELKKIAYEIINGEIQGVKLETLFPFLGKESLNEIVDLLIEKKETKALERAIPFISKDKVEKIYYAAEQGELEDFDASKCIPFLGSERIKDIFRDLIKKQANTQTAENDED